MIQTSAPTGSSQRTAVAHEVSFRISERNSRAEVPPALWTDFVVDGQRIFIRTRRPVPLLAALCASALDTGAELAEIEVMPVEAELPPGP